MVTYMNTSAIKSTPFLGTEADMHRSNAALFARKGQTGRYLQALQNLARTEGTYSPITPA